MSYHASTLMRQ